MRFPEQLTTGRILKIGCSLQSGLSLCDSSSTSTNLCFEYCRKKNRQIKEYQSEIKRGNNVNIGKLLNEQKEYQLKVETDEIEKII